MAGGRGRPGGEPGPRRRPETVGEQVDALAAEVTELLLYLPNLPADACPDGAGEQDNVVLRVEGSTRRPTASTSDSALGGR